jgi:hypothetical protein
MDLKWCDSINFEDFAFSRPPPIHLACLAQEVILHDTHIPSVKSRLLSMEQYAREITHGGAVFGFTVLQNVTYRKTK